MNPFRNTEPELPHDLQQQCAAWQEEFLQTKPSELSDEEFVKIAKAILDLWARTIRKHGDGRRRMRYQGPVPLPFVDRFNKYMGTQGFRATFFYAKDNVDVIIEKSLSL